MTKNILISTFIKVIQGQLHQQIFIIALLCMYKVTIDSYSFAVELRWLLHTLISFTAMFTTVVILKVSGGERGAFCSEGVSSISAVPRELIIYKYIYINKYNVVFSDC